MKILHLVAVLVVAGGVAACKSDDTGDVNGAGGGPGSGLGGDNGSGGALGGIESGDLQSQTAEFKSQVGDTIRFGYDSSDITGESRQTLGRQATFAQKYPNLTFSIEGHCDERGTREYNLALGERRANAAKTALVSLGVAEQRLQTISYGKERPVAVGSSETAWSQNRRAVTVIN